MQFGLLQVNGCFQLLISQVQAPKDRINAQHQSACPDQTGSYHSQIIWIPRLRSILWKKDKIPREENFECLPREPPFVTESPPALLHLRSPRG